MEPQVLRTSENKTFLSEKFLMDKAILPLVKESIIIIDVNCTILLINESAQLLIRSIIGNTYEISDCLYAMPLGDASVFRDHLHTSLHGESTSFEQHIISEDNGFWISCSFMPLRIQDQVSGVSILIEDVSLSKKLEEEEQKRKKAEEASHISRVMFELFVENAPLRAWITDISGNVLFMNQQYLNAFGFDKSKLGSNLFDLFPESLVMNYIREIRKVHKTQLISETISQGFRDDGTKGYFKISRFPMKSAGQDMVGGWAIDITEERDLQKKLVVNEFRKKQEIVRSIIEAQENERMALSRELHDNVNQILSSCQLMLEMAKDKNDTAEVLVVKCYENLKTAIQEIRSISHKLNPSAIQDIGLSEAIEELIQNVNCSGKVKVSFKSSKGRNYSHLLNEDKIAIFRILQEVLNNIIKHAGATKVTIHILYFDGKVCIKVHDNGKGFNLNKVKKGLGLRTIQHRIAYYHGKFLIESAPGMGCKLKIILYTGQSLLEV